MSAARPPGGGGFTPTPADEAHARVLLDLERAIGAAARTRDPSVSPAERTLALAGALESDVLNADTWCPACQADPESVCKEHAKLAELIDAFRRVAVRQLPARLGGEQ